MSTAKEHPILFTMPMVNAILDGKKTMTRRVVKDLRGFGPITQFDKSDTPGYDWHFRNKRMLWNDIRTDRLMESCPYGQSGDKLWVRETLRKSETSGPHGPRIEYGADGAIVPQSNWAWQKKSIPSIHMPRGCARILLEIVSVQVERVQDITAQDAKAEGVEPWWDAALDSGGEELPDGEDRAWIMGFADLWNGINDPRGFSWKSNPWVWVVEFRVLEPEGVTR